MFMADALHKTPETDVVATHCEVRNRRVYLRLSDGRGVDFPVSHYPLLAHASERLLSQVQLRLQGRALRWEALDEDIWVASAVAGKHPQQQHLQAA
jgi:Protein of unknown function (DUF2442)